MPMRVCGLEFDNALINTAALSVITRTSKHLLWTIVPVDVLRLALKPTTVLFRNASPRDPPYFCKYCIQLAWSFTG